MVEDVDAGNTNLQTLLMEFVNHGSGRWDRVRKG